jgi:site-specific DNA recombinase
VETKESRVPRAILYARVSSKGQARDGFSLEQQLERLREYAAEQGYEVLEEITDPGYSGTVLERPGLDRVRDLVEDRGVHIVIAQDADRITRNPYHRGWLDDEFAKHGTRLMALDDWGDDSHEGQLLKFVKGWQARGEAMKTAERSKRNKRKKARQGMIVGGPKPAYGFEYVRNEKGKAVAYAINEAEMSVVRRIFSEVASGKGLRPLKDELDQEGIPTPGRSSGGKVWSRTWIKKIVQNDLYRPHTVAELAEMGVSGDVLGKLDTNKVYGVYRFEGIPVPIPDASIPLEVVKAARHAVENNRSPSRAGDRFGELSGGILFCSECGRRMQYFTTTPRSTPYHYYHCVGTMSGKNDRCTVRAYVNASVIEQEVWEAVRSLMDDKEYVLRKAREHFARKRKELSRVGADTGTLAKRLEQIETKRIKYQHAYAADVLSLADLKARTAELDNERDALQRELERVMHRDEELEKLDETEREIIERIEATENNLEDKTPQERRELYQDLWLRVEVGEDKRPYISGIFPTRIGGITGTLLRTPDQRGYLYEHAGEVSKKDTLYARGDP